MCLKSNAFIQFYVFIKFRYLVLFVFLIFITYLLSGPLLFNLISIIIQKLSHVFNLLYSMLFSDDNRISNATMIRFIVLIFTSF